MEGLTLFVWTSELGVVRQTWAENYTHALANVFGDEVAEYWGPKGGEMILTQDGNAWYRKYAGE